MTSFLLLLALLAGPVAEVTAYNDHAKPMASMRMPYVGACAGPRSVPLGTMVRIGGKVYTVEDRLNRRFPKRWDIWMPTAKEAKAWGKRKLNVEIIRWRSR